jgi:hypothetical protein
MNTLVHTSYFDMHQYTVEMDNLIGPQIMFNIEKLINTTFESIRIVHLSRCTDTYANKMCTEKFTFSKSVFESK